MKTIIFIILILLSIKETYGQSGIEKLQISHLTGDFYIYTTYNSYKGNLVPANGMYVVTDDGIVMLDTPWDTTQFQPLLDSILFRSNKRVVICIATHFHEDRTGGLKYYREQGIKTYTTKLTDSLCKEHSENRAEFLMTQDTFFKVGQYTFQTYYGGAGHTTDNIVVWFDKEKILYGGCVIKSTEVNTLGNLSDANVKEWKSTIKHIQRKFKSPKYIIPGHNGWSNKRSLRHTLNLIKQSKY